MKNPKNTEGLEAPHSEIPKITMSLVNEDLDKLDMDKPKTNGGGVNSLSDRKNKINGSINTMSKGKRNRV